MRRKIVDIVTVEHRAIRYQRVLDFMSTEVRLSFPVAQDDVISYVFHKRVKVSLF